MKIHGNIKVFELEKDKEYTIILKLPPDMVKSSRKQCFELQDGINKKDARLVILERDIEVTIVENSDKLKKMKFRGK